MIHLGFPNANIYPNSGVMWENLGGTAIFKGRCFIGNDSFLSFGHHTIVEFGDKFVNEAGMKLVSGKGIKFGDDVTLGWACMIMDTNFHPLYDMIKEELKPASGRIMIGSDNWFGAECRIMHSVETPDHCTFGIGTIVTRGGEKKSYCVMAGLPMKVIAENVKRHPLYRTEAY